MRCCGDNYTFGSAQIEIILAGLVKAHSAKRTGGWPQCISTRRLSTLSTKTLVIRKSKGWGSYTFDSRLMARNQSIMRCRHGGGVAPASGFGRVSAGEHYVKVRVHQKPNHHISIACDLKRVRLIATARLSYRSRAWRWQ